jgi:hypothetical protein
MSRLFLTFRRSSSSYEARKTESMRQHMFQYQFNYINLKMTCPHSPLQPTPLKKTKPKMCLRNTNPTLQQHSYSRKVLGIYGKILSQRYWNICMNIQSIKKLRQFSKYWLNSNLKVTVCWVSSKKVFPQGELMWFRNIKALKLCIPKLWPRLQFQTENTDIYEFICQE